MPLVKLNPDLLTQRLDNETVILSPQTGRYYTLDSVASRIWEALSAHADTECAIVSLLDQFEVDETVLRQDLARFVAQLTETGLATLEEHHPE